MQPYPINDEYRESERKRVARLFSRGKHAPGFPDKKALVDWWMLLFEETRGVCAYCKTPIRLIEALIEAGRLQTRTVKGAGIRGPRLELERRDPRAPYSPANCALICYYCNNDKSYIYSEAEYVEFFAPARRRHFECLAGR